MDTTSFFDPYTRAVPSTIKCRLRVPLREYQWIKSLTLRDIQNLQPCEKGWGRAEQNSLYQDLQHFLAQPSTNDGDHVTVEELYKLASSQFPGRLFCTTGCQSLYRPLRAHILAKTADLDQSCAMQRILLWTCKQFSLSAPELEHYVEHREQCLNELMQSRSITKAKAKQLFQIAWTSRKPLRDVKDDFLRRYDQEAKGLQSALMCVEKLRWIRPFCNEEKDNLEGSFISHLFQYVESRLTLCVYEDLQSAGFEVAALIFDGLHLADGSLFDSQHILDRAHRACESIAPGINMIWAWKPADYTIRSKQTKEDIRELRIPDDFHGGAHDNDDKEQAFLAEAEIFNKYVIKVDCEYIDYQRDPKNPTRSSKEDIRKRYCHIQYYWTVAGKRKREHFIDRWLDGYDGMAVYNRSDFVPPALNCDPDVYNTWTPWPCESFELTAARDQLVYLLGAVLKHIAILANHKKSNYDFILKFFAQYVQFVHKKGGVMLILSGEQGCGKSTFVTLLKLMFGAHFFSTSKPDQNVWGKFNRQIDSKTLIELSELDRGDVHGNIDHVKDLISNDTMWIEGKGTNGYTTRNYLRFLGITNNPVPVRDGRRNGCVECSPELVYHKHGCQCIRCIELRGYHKEMNDVVCVDPNTARILYEYLKAYDLKGLEVLTAEDLPQNELQERVAEASLPQEARFLRHLAETAEQTTYTANDLWVAFDDWRKTYEPGHMHIKGQSDFCIKMGILVRKTRGCSKGEQRVIDNEGVKTHHRPRTWVFDWKPLCNHFGIELDDGDDTQRRIPECIPEAKICDLDAEAQEFVAHYLDAALLATPEASQSGWDLERDLEDEEEIERLRL